MSARRFALRSVISTAIFPTDRIRSSVRAIIRGATSCARAAGSRWQRICRGAWKRWSASCATARIGSAELAPVKAGCISVQTLPAGVVPHACGARRACGIECAPTSSASCWWLRHAYRAGRACGIECAADAIFLREWFRTLAERCAPAGARCAPMVSVSCWRIQRVCGIGWVPTSSSLQTWFRTPAVRRACGNEWLSSRLCPREQPFAICGRDRSEKRHG